MKELMSGGPNVGPLGIIFFNRGFIGTLFYWGFP